MSRNGDAVAIRKNPEISNCNIVAWLLTNLLSAAGIHWCPFLDEYAQMAPKTWSEVIRPALSDRLGWAIFIGTPKGRNGFFTLYEAARADPDWYAAVFKASQTGVIDKGELAKLKAEMPAEEYEQEFECSFAAANAGAYYGREMTDAEESKRIGRVPWEPRLGSLRSPTISIGPHSTIRCASMTSGHGIANHSTSFRSVRFSKLSRFQGTAKA